MTSKFGLLPKSLAQMIRLAPNRLLMSTETFLLNSHTAHF